ncbi:inositol monophosphatase family protein [Brucellaceae bacterium D45D]
MMHNEDEARLRFDKAKEIIREAGDLALSYFQKLSTLEIETKANGQDVVSIADRDVERLIRQRLSAAFPDDGFFGEEYGLAEGSSDYCWVIDPIDGTSCFLHDTPTWCVAIALVCGDETLAGLIFDPNRDELFAALSGRGAEMNGRAISVDLATDLQHGLTSVGANGRIPPSMISGFIDNLLQEGGMFVRSGSGALSLVHVACGRLAAYYEPHMNAWDCLAAQCIIREAGGWANDFLGEGDIINGGPVIGCAPQLRGDILRLLEITAK